MIKLTVIPSDKTIYVDGTALFDFDLSFVPENIHALQWGNNSGWIECKDEPNEVLEDLPDWAMQCVSLWQTKLDAIHNPAPVEPTLPDYISALKRHFDSVAQERNYNNELSAVSYVNSINLKWKNEAAAYIEWRDKCWEYGYQELEKFQNGSREMISIESFILELPLIQWPAQENNFIPIGDEFDF